jgi:nitrilase
VQNATFKAACVQAAPVYLELEGTVSKTIALIEEAASNGAKLIAFPETWIPGYPWFIWLGAPVWSMQFTKRYYESSLRLDGPEMLRIREAAKRFAIHVVLGYSEQDGGSLYMGQCLIDANGNLLFNRRKLKPTHAERMVFGEGDGSDFQVAKTAFGNIGALCCWEHLQPLSRYALYSMNEQIHVASWPSVLHEPYVLGPEVNSAASRMYAVEGQCYVIASWSLLSQEMFDLLCDTPDKVRILSAQTGRPGGGNSMIYGPDGRALCEPLEEDQEGILYADIDIGLIPFSKAAADPVGHYSRPDVVRLMINRTKNVRVQEFESFGSVASSLTPTEGHRVLATGEATPSSEGARVPAES